METINLKNTLIASMQTVRNEHPAYVDSIANFINSATLKNEYNDNIEFLSDLFKSQTKSFFTISSKESFSTFTISGPHIDPFIYTPLNDHSRVHMHRGDIVFCYRQGQFESLDDALQQRGIYGVGIVASEPEILFEDKTKHERYGVLIVMPFALESHLKLREIQLNPITINLTPYNGNRNDALQYIDSDAHVQALLNMLAKCNPTLKTSIESITGKSLQNVKLPSEVWHETKKNINSLDYCQKIFFGAPGTGKSHKIDYDLLKDDNGNSTGTGLKNSGLQDDQVWRTTFHPDYDYAQFVGAYKPKKEHGDLTYEFVPQVFAKAYVAAWLNYLNPSEEGNIKPIYLVIEEVNRGNCAQIFGDIFQLLDRDENGFSCYEIEPDTDFAQWLNAQNIVGLPDKLRLPPNFNILATMNTSDQSLFPMDSAFKRRFDWEYVPIDYTQAKANFTIEIGDKKYSWLKFLKAVNDDIKSATLSEDKQMGEFFVKPKDNTIDLDMFRSKVLFYLWDSVYKEETSYTKVFHFPKEDGKDDKVSFQTYFEGTEEEQIALVQKIFDTDHLNVEQVIAPTEPPAVTLAVAPAPTEEPPAGAPTATDVTPETEA